MKNWKCPRCGSGKRAPERPRREDARRYCLPCSEKTGRLVERECPALAVERAKKREESKRKQRSQRIGKAVAERMRHDANGVDTRDVVRRALRLPSVLAEMKATHSGLVGKRGPRMPSLRVRRCKRFPRGRLGCAWVSAYQMELSVWPGCDADRIRATLVHEVVHLCLPYGESHGAAFCATLKAAREDWTKRYPDEPLPPPDSRYAL